MGTMQQGQKEVFVVEGLGGEKPLSGSVRINGSKNAALPAFAAALLFKHPVHLSNIPSIEDISRVCELLEGIGAEVEQGKKKGEYTLTSPHEGGKPQLNKDIAKRLRASVIFTGPLLARYGEVQFPHPGGCVIGPRPIDLFLSAYEAMGARSYLSGETYVLSAPEGLHGAEIFFKNQSVTATEAIMMAAVLAEGTTTLHNVALEPEVTSVAEFLRDAGAHITGIGSTTLTIKGGGVLTTNKPHYQCIPDRIETGSFLILGALTAESLTLTDIDPTHILSLITLLQESGVDLTVEKKSLHIKNGRPNRSYRAVNVKTHEYPGFPTDLQAPLLTYLTQVSGESLVFETVFENRLGYTEDLLRMGANIKVFNPHQAVVVGPTPLKGRHLESPDIRAGLAFLIAAIVASGPSVVHNVYYIDRGYEHIEERLQALGVSIRRELLST